MGTPLALLLRGLLAVSIVVLFLIAAWVVRATVPNVPPPCETSIAYSTWPTIATLGAVFAFWLGGRYVHRAVKIEPYPPPPVRAIPVYVTLTAALLITALLLGYEVYAVATQARPDITITHYVRCSYGALEALVSTASVAGAWAVCFILGHWLSYRIEQ